MKTLKTIVVDCIFVLSLSVMCLMGLYLIGVKVALTPITVLGMSLIVMALRGDLLYDQPTSKEDKDTED